VRRPWRFRGRAPLAVAGLLAFPTLMAALMASSLAIERPQVFVWLHNGHVITRYKDPSNLNEAKIWLFAALPPLLLLLVGIVAMWLPRGVYAAAITGIVGALVLPLRLDSWTVHHAQRFPDGIDLLPPSDTSNIIDKGQWEAAAKHTVLNLQKWTIGLALAILVVAAAVEVRRRRGAPPPPPPPPPVSGETTIVTAAGGLDPFS
jgi:hypothetical protein